MYVGRVRDGARLVELMDLIRKAYFPSSHPNTTRDGRPREPAGRVSRRAFDRVHPVGSRRSTGPACRQSLTGQARLELTESTEPMERTCRSSTASPRRSAMRRKPTGVRRLPNGAGTEVPHPPGRFVVFLENGVAQNDHALYLWRLWHVLVPCPV